MKTTKQIMTDAREAKHLLSRMHPDTDAILMRIAECLIKDTDAILAANRLDMEAAKGVIGDVMLDRLRLDGERILAMADGIRQISRLPSPIGEVFDKTERPNGLVIQKVRVPIGVIAIIYESRPGVTSDAAALALKSGNACILRSGKEAWRSSRAITDSMSRAIKEAGLPENVIQLVEDTRRESALELMNGRGYIDLLIPRGGAGLIRACVEGATVPCLETGTGICHVYIDEDADEEKALDILDNAKTSRPSVCNAAEVCLIHRDIAPTLLPKIKARLTDKRAEKGLVPVELLLDGAARTIIDGTAAEEGDFDTEFLDYRLAVGIVDSVEEAIEHISRHSTGHSEAIITEDEAAAELFLSAVDSAAVYHNASTRFTDGGEFGLGCEMGISTQKMHARGPLGIKELTTYKYVIKGNGQIRS